VVAGKTPSAAGKLPVSAYTLEAAGNWSMKSKDNYRVMRDSWKTKAALALGAAWLLSGAGEAVAQTPPAPVPASRTIVIETPEANSTEALVTAEMAKLVNAGGTVRLVPQAGQGSVQSIGDLLNLRHVNAAIVQSDVLANFKRTQPIPGIQTKIQYITKLYSEEVHVLARMRYLCLSDLNGRRVNFGPSGSGAGVTAQALFDAFNIKPQPLYLEQGDAFAKLKKGEIDAMIYVGGKPSPAFQRIKYTDRVHFLDVDFIDPLHADYVPALLTHDDYPDLVASDETVNTISMSAVLVLADRRIHSQQYRNVAALVENLFHNLRRTRSGAFHPKWQEVNIKAPFQDWTRFPAARAWLSNNATALARAEAVDAALLNPEADPNAAPESTQDARKIRAEFKQFMTAQGRNTQADRDLFNEFVRWYEVHKDQ
jgi:TRAP transporter TAXI family solute receptor